MAEQNPSSEKAEHQLVESIENFIERYYQDSDCVISRVKHNIWTIQEEHYVFNIIITSILVIFDTELFNRLPQEKNMFFEELLRMNSHFVRSAKLCLVKDQVHIRVLRGLEGFDYSEFASHVDEFREIYPEICDKLASKFYSAVEED